MSDAVHRGPAYNVASQRFVWGVLAAVAVTVLGLSIWLTPNPHGAGTHTQLGLPPCGFWLVTGLPCPGCGLTTSFAFMAHLDPLAATRVNPFGVPLFLTTVAAIPFCLRGLYRGDHVMDTLDAHAVDRYLLLLSATGILVWVVRLATLMAQ